MSPSRAERGRPRVLGVGTVALDTVEGPAGSVSDAPGGSALYFAAGAAGLARVAVVGVAGDDLPGEALAPLAAAGVDVGGIRRVPGRTLRWHARYRADGSRETVAAERGVTVTTPPVVPAGLRDPDALFLGSTDPRVQGSVLGQAGRADITALDTMEHWIRDRRAELAALLGRVDVALMNEEEVRVLAGAGEEEGAARTVRRMGPAWVVVKRGARGARAWGAEGVVDVGAPAVEEVDPTGAGDAFAGGLIAALAAEGSLDAEAMERALAVAVERGARAVTAFSFGALLGG